MFIKKEIIMGEITMPRAIMPVDHAQRNIIATQTQGFMRQCEKVKHFVKTENHFEVLEKIRDLDGTGGLY
jgi:hypothetical protein